VTDNATERSGSNGEAFRPDAAALIGAAVGKHLAGLLGEILPQVIGDAFARVLQAVPVRVERRCCKCLAARMAWEASNAAAINDALQIAMIEAGITDRADPRCRTLDPSPYLPDGCVPPVMMDAVTITGGEEVCPLHLPGAPQQPGRRPFLVAQTGNVKAAAEAVGQG
jgi:hypothetical protein